VLELKRPETVEEIRQKVSTTLFNLGFQRLLDPNELHLEGAEYVLEKLLGWIDGEWYEVE